MDITPPAAPVAEPLSDLAANAAETAGGADGSVCFNPLVGFGTADLVMGMQALAAQFVRQPWSLMAQNLALLTKLTEPWLGRPGLEPARGDKRFADPIWDSNPFYRAVKQSYLAWSAALEEWVERAGLDPKNQARAQMVVSLLSDAVAPTNSVLGNPIALKRLLETGGASGLRGLQNFVQDLVGNGGMPAQVDKSGFRVGGNLAVSPGAVVFSNEVLELIQYAPTTEQVHTRPLLIVPPQINKFYLFDLAPGRSVIEYLTASGQQVFALSWRNPRAKHGRWRLETYVHAMLEAIEAVCDITGSSDLNIGAACSGGITATILLGHLAALRDRRVNAATLLVCVLDNSVTSQLGNLATRETIGAVRLKSRRKGVLEGEELARVFAWMRPNDLVWNYWVNNYLLGNQPPAFDILYWNSDTTRLPAGLHSDYLDLMLYNPLPRRGALTVLGTPIDLRKVECDLLMVAGITDHITPWQGCYAATQMLGGAHEFLLSSSGHIQTIISPTGNTKAKFYRSAQQHMPSDPAAWLAAARAEQGSWWPYWRDWLAARSGDQRPAPAELGNARHPRGVQAPGTYVFEQ
jgi:polyhydroxyalkanoate synthase